MKTKNMNVEKKLWKKPKIMVIRKEELDKWVMASACSTLGGCKNFNR